MKVMAMVQVPFWCARLDRPRPMYWGWLMRGPLPRSLCSARGRNCLRGYQWGANERPRRVWVPGRSKK